MKLATVFEGNLKAPFSIATTLICRGGRKSFPSIAPRYPRYVPCKAENQIRRYQVPFFNFGMTGPGIEPRSLGPLANALPTNQVDRVFTNGPGDLVSIPGPVIPKTFKMVLDTSLLNTPLYKVLIKDKVEESWERRSVLLYTSV